MRQVRKDFKSMMKSLPCKILCVIWTSIGFLEYYVIYKRVDIGLLLGSFVCCFIMYIAFLLMVLFGILLYYILYR